MNSSILFAVLSLVAADLAGDLEAVASNADTLNGKVTSWSKSDGLVGALGIQNAYPPLSAAVGDLSGSVSSASQDDVLGQADGISKLASSVVTLLNSLTEKASDVQSVGANDIVKNDIDGLSGATKDIVAGLVKAAGDEVPADLAKDASELGNAFSSAIAAYGANPVEFPEVSAGSGSDSKSEATSEGASSESATTEAADSSAATSKAAGDATSVVEETVTETICTHASCTGVVGANGAARNAVFGGVAAIAAALL